MTKKIDEILARYFGGNASQKDMDALELWLSSGSENLRHFDELTILYRQLGCPENRIPTPNIQQAKARFMAYMDKKDEALPLITKSGTSKPFFKTWMFRAASILILLTISVSIWYTKYSVKDILLTTGINPIEKLLPDGTRLLLSKNSKVTYRSNFGEKERIIHLTGEATVHAGHSGKGRLQIKTDRLIIEDIGTIFTISAYPDSSNIVVSVKEGQVSLITEKNKHFSLKANEIGRFDKRNETFHTSNLVKVKQQILPNQQPILPYVPSMEAKDASTKKYDFQFDSKPLRTVVEAISQEYGENIQIENSEIGMQKITVQFDHEKLEVILEIIAETMNLKVQKVADGYMLSSKK